MKKKSFLTSHHKTIGGGHLQNEWRALAYEHKWGGPAHNALSGPGLWACPAALQESDTEGCLPHSPLPLRALAVAPGEVVQGAGGDCVVTHAGQIPMLLGARRQLGKDCIERVGGRVCKSARKSTRQHAQASQGIVAP